MNPRLLTTSKVIRIAAALLALRLIWIWAMPSGNGGVTGQGSNPELSITPAQSLKKTDPLLEAIRLADKDAAAGEKALRELIASKENAGARNALGVLYLRQKKADLAAAELDKAVAADPKLADAWFNRGSARVLLGDMKGALSDYLKVVELKPKAPGQLQIAETEVKRLRGEK